MTLCSSITAARPLMQAGTFSRSAISATRCPTALSKNTSLHGLSVNGKFSLGRNGKVARSRYTIFAVNYVQVSVYRITSFALASSLGSSTKKRSAWNTFYVLRAATSHVVCGCAGLLPAQLWM